MTDNNVLSLHHDDTCAMYCDVCGKCFDDDAVSISLSDRRIVCQSCYDLLFGISISISGVHESDQNTQYSHTNNNIKIGG